MTGMEIIVWILGVLSTILGGLNIMQLLTFKSYKRKAGAEAYQSEINALRSIIETNQAEIGRLSQRIALSDKRAIEQDNRYNELSQRYYELKQEFESYKLNNK